MTNGNDNSDHVTSQVGIPDDRVVHYLELALFDKVRDKLVAWAKLWGIIFSVVIVATGIFGVRGFLAVDVKSEVRGELQNYKTLTDEAVNAAFKAKGAVDAAQKAIVAWREAVVELNREIDLTKRKSREEANKAIANARIDYVANLKATQNLQKAILLLHAPKPPALSASSKEKNEHFEKLQSIASLLNLPQLESTRSSDIADQVRAVILSEVSDPPKVDITFGYAGIGNYRLYLEGDDQNPPVNFWNGNNTDSIPDSFLLATAPTSWRNRILTIDATVASPTLDEEGLYSISIYLTQSGKPVRGSPIVFTGTLSKGRANVTEKIKLTVN